MSRCFSRVTLFLFCAALGLSFSSCEYFTPESHPRTETPAKKSYLNSNSPLPDLVAEKGLSKKDLKIVIDKSAYTLTVVSENGPIKEYPVVFGSNPIDDKLREGDRCTPEGEFKVQGHYAHKSWSKFIWLDYPNKGSWKKHKEAKTDGRIPKDAKIGSEIGIHGIPAHRPNLIADKVNWTWGCISLTNPDVDDLYTMVHKGMTIEIVK